MNSPSAALPERPWRGLHAVFFAVALAVVAAVHLTSIPLTIWEYDESLFAMGVESYEPLIHHPPPPGYPLYMGTAQLLAPAAGYVPFRTLVGLSAVTTLLGFLAFALAFKVISGTWRVGVFGSFLFYVTPAMLLHATLPQSDSGALMLLAVSLALTATVSSWPGDLPAANQLPRGTEVPEEPRYQEPPTWLIALTAIACAATVGWRLQFAIAILPLFGTSVLLLRSWRARAIAVQWFAIACAAWFIPLVVLTDGPEGFWKWLSGQAAYFAEHDADLSRSGRTPAEIALKFIAHPWGPKWLALPVLALAVVGLADAARRRMRAIVPVVVMALVYLAFALRMMDPADGVRYALPSVPAVALFAVLGLEALRRLSRGILVDWGLLGLYALGAWVYIGPLLQQRATQPSPPVAAIRYLREVAPRNAVILYDMPLKPHAEYLLRGYTRTRIDEGLLRFGHRVDVPIFQLTDNATEIPGGKVFRWRTGDPYNKLTRGHYGAASVIPLPARERFLALSGISAPERTRTGSWRWIGARGVLMLPDLRAGSVRLTLGLPPDYPLDGNGITAEVDGIVGTTHVALVKGQKATIELRIPAGRTRIRLAADRSFVPAELPGSLNRDARRLSVMLLGVEQSLSAASTQTGATAIAR